MRDLDAIPLVEQDVREGLAPVLNLTGFELLEPFASATPMTNGRFTAIPWRAFGTNDKPVNNIEPTHRAVSLVGITIVEDVDGDLRYHRFVDWNMLAATLGVSRGRGTARPQDAPAPDDGRR